MTWATFEPIVSAITDTFTVSGFLGTLAGIFSAALVFVGLWWVIKRIIKVIMGAINGGTLSSGASNRRRR